MLGACHHAWHFFVGRGVGFEEFHARVDRPLHAVSRNLGNPAHVDVYDASPDMRGGSGGGQSSLSHRHGGFCL